uniref:ATP synthase F0 subunit 8 n=1 Tax=Parascaris equorum TaxID=6256 RepID=A0A914SK84_PAREQ
MPLQKIQYPNRPSKSIQIVFFVGFLWLSLMLSNSRSSPILQYSENL